MSERTIVTIAEGPVTRLGQLVLAGEVIDAEPIMSSTLRVMDANVLSVLIDGEGNYRDADGRDERLRPDPPGDRAHPRFRRRVPPVPLPVPLQRLPSRLPPYLSYYARFGDGGEQFAGVRILGLTDDVERRASFHHHALAQHHLLRLDRDRVHDVDYGSPTGPAEAARPAHDPRPPHLLS